MSNEEQIEAWEAWDEESQGAFPCQALRQFVAANFCSLTADQKQRVQALCQSHACHCIYPSCG